MCLLLHRSVWLVGRTKEQKQQQERQKLASAAQLADVALDEIAQPEEMRICNGKCLRGNDNEKRGT